MTEILTVINTIAIIGLILLQVLIFRQGKPKMNHLTKWMQKQESINLKLAESIDDLNKHRSIHKTEIEILFERTKTTRGKK